MNDQSGAKKSEQHEDSLLAEYCRTRDIELRNQLVGNIYISLRLSRKNLQTEALNMMTFFKLLLLHFLKHWNVMTYQEDISFPALLHQLL